MTVLFRIAAFTGLGLTAAGCMSLGDPYVSTQGRVDGPLGPNFGQALASMDVQIIDPTPAAGLPGTSAARAAAAIERYEVGKVLVPQLGTSAFMGGEGSGGGEGLGGSSAGAGAQSGGSK